MIGYRFRLLLCCWLGLMTAGCSGGRIAANQLGLGAIAARSVGHTKQIIEVGPEAGKGIGYVIANEADRARAQAMSDASAGSNYSHSELGPLTNTRWRVRSLAPEDAGGERLSMLATFRPSGHLVTRTILPDSTMRLMTERYRVVGDTLIINNDGYLVNAQYRINGETLTIIAGDFVGVFDRVRSRDGL